MNNQTHISELKLQSASLMKHVLKMLGWTMQQYADFKYERGIAYIRWYVPAQDQVAKELMHSRLFWNWWKNCWDLRDEVFVANCGYDRNLSDAQAIVLYKHLHDARALATEIRPSVAVIKDALNVAAVMTIKEVNV